VALLCRHVHICTERPMYCAGARFPHWPRPFGRYCQPSAGVGRACSSWKFCATGGARCALVQEGSTGRKLADEPCGALMPAVPAVPAVPTHGPVARRCAGFRAARAKVPRLTGWQAALCAPGGGDWRGPTLAGAKTGRIRTLGAPLALHTCTFGLGRVRLKFFPVPGLPIGAAGQNPPARPRPAPAGRASCFPPSVAR
jgi:hypothetical protein